MMKAGYDLVITIVNKGFSNLVIAAAQEAGAKGATVLRGRGSGLKNVPQLFGIPIEPEKEIVLNAVPEEISEAVADSIAKSITLKNPGTGISIVLPLKGVVGLVESVGKDQLSTQ